MTISLPVEAFSAKEMYFLLRDCVVPRPIAWVSTVDAQGRPNLAPYSFFNVCSPEPPVVGFSVGPRNGYPGNPADAPKDTLANVRATRELVVNIVPESLRNPMVQSSAALPAGEDEFAFAGLEAVPSTVVGPPRVAGAPVAFECVLHDIVVIGSSAWVMGRVVHAHIDERVYRGQVKDMNHRVDPTLVQDLTPVGRLGRANYTLIRDIETILSPSGGPTD